MWSHVSRLHIAIPMPLLNNRCRLLPAVVPAFARTPVVPAFARTMRNKATPSAGKAKADAARGAAGTRFAQRIRVAMRSGEESEVQAVIKEAYRANVSKAVVQKAVDRIRDRGRLEDVLYEATLPGGVCVLIEVLTDNKNRTVKNVKHTLKEGGGQLGASGAAMWAFQRRAVLDFEPVDEAARDALVDDVMSHDAVEDLEDRPPPAADNGTDAEGAVGVAGVRVWTAPTGLAALRDALAPHSHSLVNDQSVYAPMAVVEPSDAEAAASMEETVAHLKALDDVEEVWTNASEL